MPDLTASPALSVIIPTRNRASALRDTLKGMLSQDIDPSLYELIVVDNNSTDATRQTVGTMLDDYGSRLSYVHEPSPGLVYARNRGAMEARADILVFGDDDLTVGSGWLSSFMDAMADPDTAIAGGRIFPVYEQEPPEWIRDFIVNDEVGSWMMYLGFLDLGENIKSIPANYVFGGNCAIRRDVLFECGGFHPDSLPSPGLLRYRGDGESGLELELERRGYRAAYQPAASVGHFCPKEKNRFSFFCYRAFSEGISHSYTAIRNAGRISHIQKRSPDEIMRTDMLAWGIMERTFNFEAGTPGEMKALVSYCHDQGMAYHRDQVLSDPELLDWVLRKDYFPPAPPLKEAKKFPRHIAEPRMAAEEIMRQGASDLLSEGITLLQHRRYADALDRLNNAMYLSPSGDIQAARAVCLMESGLPSEAESAAYAVTGDINLRSSIIRRIQQSRFANLMKETGGLSKSDLSWVDGTTLLPENAVIYITEKCNSRCITCNFWRTRHEDSLSTEEWQGILRQVRDTGVLSVEFVGGEPLMRKDLPSLVSSSSELGFSSVIVSSNGFLLTEDAIRDLVSRGVNCFHISLDGFSDTYKAIRGVDWFDRVVRASSLILSMGIPVLVLTNLTRPVVEELVPLADMVIGMGASWSVNILENSKYGFAGVDLAAIAINSPGDIDHTVSGLRQIRKNHPAACLLSDSDILYIRDYLEDPEREKKIPCSTGFRDIYVDPKGHLYSACMSMRPVGNANTCEISGLLESPDMKSNLKAMLLRNCKGCTCGFSQRASLMHGQDS